MASLTFSSTLAQCDPKNTCVLIVGKPADLALISYNDVKMKLEPRVDEKTFTMLVGTLHPNPTDTCSLWLNNATLAALPAKRSRHNSFSASHMLSKVVKTNLSGGEEHVVIVCQRQDVFASACAVARVLPLYSMKSVKAGKRNVRVEFLLVGPDADKSLNEQDLQCLAVAGESIRLTASIVDKPCSEMNTDAFLEEIKRVGADLNIKPVIIRGKDLQEKGFGGLWHVGKAATAPPALVVLSHRVEGATKNIAWVGKGIVYDTGGLCIKSKSSMCTMKRDCGGAAGILGAFYTTVKMGFKENLHAVFCLAENAVGSNALRPDDIITLYSGRTVEINNTDAEGRLVLGDGVAYAVKDLKATTVVDMATLTGAQGIATGRYHASIVCNDDTMERLCVLAGQHSGDLVHPMPYTPELHFTEFSSTLADMKNSVADRSNAQVSCAGLFIHSHLGFDFPGVWLHVDMASPVAVGERATGYGVALLSTLFGQDSLCGLLQSIAPSAVCNGVENEEGNAAKKMRLV